MSSIYKQRDRFDKYSTILRNFCDENVLSKEVTEFFNDKIVGPLIDSDIYTLDDLLILDKEYARSLFVKSGLFKLMVDVLGIMCKKHTPQYLNDFKKGKSHILIEPFIRLKRVVRHSVLEKIDFKYTNYSLVEKTLSSIGVTTYGQLYVLGAKGVAGLANFGDKGYVELIKIIDGEIHALETGEVLHTSKWIKEEKTRLKEARPKVAKKEKIKVKTTKTKSKSKKTKKSKYKTIPTKKVFSLYGLASGKPGKKFSIKTFLEITKNAKKKPGGANTDKTIKLPDGYIYEADSQQEISTLKKLISHDTFKRLRGQCINIPYRFGGKLHNYYPDFIILTQTNKIVILEVKEIAQMNTKQNLRKYDALRRYCQKHGYLYIMCDKFFTPFEKLAKRPMSTKVANAIDDALEDKGYFDYSDFRELVKGVEHKKLKTVRNSIGIYVKVHKKTVKMLGDLTYNSSKFKIIKIKK